ncbi:MAG: hypothetical protein RRC07_11250, partial [Anaerolineae bacterium]|nr:hypothetical protein [Anaerolineae bacterium]
MRFWLLVASLLVISLILKLRRSRSRPVPAGDAVADAQVGEAIAVFLGGGLALVMLAFAIYQARVANPPWLLYPLLIAGVLSFLLAGHSASQGYLPAAQHALWSRLAGWFQIRPAQLILLLLALLLSLLAYLAGGDRLTAWHPAAAV